MLTGKVTWQYWLSSWVRVLIRLESQSLESHGQELQDVRNDLESSELGLYKGHGCLGIHPARLQNAKTAVSRLSA